MKAARELRDGDWPDCYSDGCEDDENGDIPCEGCPLTGKKYHRLRRAMSDPLYRAAAKWIFDHELGLTRFWDEPDYRTIEAIRFVSGERNRLEEQARKWKDDNE